MSHVDVDHAAADAVVAHHSELSAALTRRVALLRAAARAGSGPQWREHRQGLATWLRAELLPHAAAEETVLYPTAMAHERGRLLVEGMLAEHQAVARLVTELETSGTAIDAAGAARALAALFEVHLRKENDLVLPLLLTIDDVSLAGIVDGMHDLLGAEAHPGDHGGGGCGCGGDHGDAAAPAPVLTVDARLDVRTVPHAQRHATVLAAVTALPADGALVLVAPHAPLPLLAEIEHRLPGQIDTAWLQEGPDVWQVRLHRAFVAAP